MVSNKVTAFTINPSEIIALHYLLNPFKLCQQEGGESPF